MRNEARIVLPFYKIAYAFSFVVLLSLIRSVTYTYEVGIAIKAPFAILTTVFCADSYTQEIAARRSEIHRLYQVKKRFCSVMKRIVIQEIFLLLAVVGYGLFLLFQKPMTHPAALDEMPQFVSFLFAVTVTILFWGILANTLSMLFRNMWMGIGGCLLLWVAANSGGGDRILGGWNLFSYTFRRIENATDITWLYGKGLCICGGLILLAALPEILKKRG